VEAATDVCDCTLTPGLPAAADTLVEVEAFVWDATEVWADAFHASTNPASTTKPSFLMAIPPAPH
jgi:hypothetical protein